MLLKQHRYEPILEAQFAGAKDVAAKVVVVQRALPRQHRFAQPSAVGQSAAKGFDEAAGSFHQHAVAHRRHRGDPCFEQGGGDRTGRLFTLCGLTCFKKDQRNAVVIERRAKLIGVEGLVAAIEQLGLGPGLFETEPTEPFAGRIDAVAVEMEHMVGGPGAPR